MIFSKQRSILLSALAVAAIGIQFLPAAYSAEPGVKPVDLPKANPKQTTEDVLSDLRDARLCLSQVKLQAVNVFM